MRQLAGTYLLLSVSSTSHTQVIASSGGVPAAIAAPPEFGVRVSTTSLASAVYVTVITPVVSSTSTVSTISVAVSKLQPRVRSSLPYTAFSATVVLAAEAMVKPSEILARTV